MIKNLYTIIKEINKNLKELATYEEGGEDVSEEESKMFEALNDFIACADEYLETEKDKPRKFEVGAYLNSNIELIQITRVEDKSIYVNTRFNRNRRCLKNGDCCPTLNLRA